MAFGSDAGGLAMFWISFYPFFMSEARSGRVHQCSAVQRGVHHLVL
jgi:hypothetical protein